MPFRLQALRDLRRRAEEEAEQALGQAVKARGDAEKVQAQKDEQVAAARAQREAAAQRAGREAIARAADALDRERYLERLAAEVRRLKDEADAHRRGPLQAAREAEAAARRRLGEARREREALDKLKAKQDAEARKLTERRAEDAAGDLALALRARRDKD